MPEHFLLITKHFKPQTHLLEAGDLAAAYACVESYREHGQELFAFFNSGEHSGASQPHRHLQMLPVGRMRDGLGGEDDGRGWQVLADGLAAGAGPELPFAAFAERLRPGMGAGPLRDAYLRLYRRACAAAGVDAAGQTGGEARISYNVAVTGGALVVCPRAAGGAAVVDAGGRAVGELALNGTVLAGTALVRNEAEWDALRGDPSQLWSILGRIGLAPTPTSAKDGKQDAVL